MKNCKYCHNPSHAKICHSCYISNPDARYEVLYPQAKPQGEQDDSRTESMMLYGEQH